MPHGQQNIKIASFTVATEINYDRLPDFNAYWLLHIDTGYVK
jgi:hypothetical protein